jgi:hypothetical protein
VPLVLLEDRVPVLPVWHVTDRAAPEDPVLGDRDRGAAAELMHRSGLSEHWHEYEGVP